MTCFLFMTLLISLLFLFVFLDIFFSNFIQMPQFWSIITHLLASVSCFSIYFALPQSLWLFQSENAPQKGYFKSTGLTCIACEMAHIPLVSAVHPLTTARVPPGQLPPVRFWARFLVFVESNLGLRLCSCCPLLTHLHLPILLHLQLRGSPEGWTGGPQTEQHPCRVNNLPNTG